MRLGNQTILVEGISSGTNSGTSRPAGGFTKDGGSNSYSTNDGTDWKQSARALLTPDEVMRLPQRTLLAFLPGMPPVATTMIRHFEENLNPGRIRRALGAFRVLIVSCLVLGLTAALAVGLASIEKPVDGPLAIHQHVPARVEPKQQFQFFKGE